MRSINIDSWLEVPSYFTGHVIHSNGTEYWLEEGNPHREDGPAMIYPDGQCWYLNNKNYSKDNYYRELYRLGKITQEELFIELL